jgi:hypothetical protein
MPHSGLFALVHRTVGDAQISIGFARQSMTGPRPDIQFGWKITVGWRAVVRLGVFEQMR